MLAVLADTDTIRKFQSADLMPHRWIIDRLLKAYPHLTQGALVGWISGLIFNNAYLFLYQENAVALAQVTNPTLGPRIVVVERFVWARDPKNLDHVKQAADFYECFQRWARGMDAVEIEVGILTDVPREAITEKLGRIFEQKRLIARV